MTALLRVLSGARTGHVVTSDGSPINVGRESGLELRFDPERDLDVSARHATITCENEAWWLRDLGSRNGTFVNGQRIDRVTPLRDGDELMFGAGGPRVEFRAVQHRQSGDYTIPTTQSYVPAASSGPSHTTQIRAARSHARQWQLIAVVGALLLSAVIGLLVINTQRERRAWERERSALLAQKDSAVNESERAIAALQGDLAGLADALRASQAQVREIGTRLDRAQRSDDAARLPALRTELKGAIATLNRQQAAAGIDHEAIRRLNDKAVARIYAELPSGEVATGTAFAVRPDATFLTSRHVVSAEDGSPAKRLALQFSYSDQVWPARVIAVDQELDLAVVKVDAILGAVPTVQPLSLRPDTMRTGAPVLMIGFPLGGESMPSGRAGHSIIKPVLGAGILTSMHARQLEVQGYGATGSSGSPVFNRDGEVVGIVFGGRREAGNHFLVAVPSSAANRLIGSVVK